MTDPVPMDTFDICGPLPTGTTLLEASAGTGKTWTIAALVTRYLAEGVATLEEMLVVTFTRAASQELRDRVRRQLDDAAAVLADPTTADPANRLHDWLLDADATERTTRLGRLTDALTSYDAATIATIHQFCQLVLRSLGVAGDTDTGAVLVEDLEQLTNEVTDDRYLQLFARQEQAPWTRDAALTIARAVVDDPRARVAPQEALTDDPDGGAAARVRFACDVLDEIDRRKRRLGVLSYDDLLGQLADALGPDDSPARARMRQRWKVALIDEFQDTDPVQWQVFQRAFHGAATLVLIGDPKQAIYAFRGGDIVTYLEAAEQATTRQTLGVNWRADQPLLDSLHVLVEGAALGDERITVHPVTAHHPSSRLEGAGVPFRLRVVRHEELGRKKPRIGDWRQHVLTDLAADVKRLLTSGATVSTGPDDDQRRLVEPTGGFDARFSALRRRYSYRISDDASTVDPLRRHDTVQVRHRLDVAAMDDAAGLLLGLHDFAAFCRRREGATTVRTLLGFSWAREADGVVVGTVIADAFCHSMVRALVGSVVPVGEGRLDVGVPREVLAAAVRDPRVKVMPPHGLSLEEVVYPPDAELAARADEARSTRTLPPTPPHPPGAGLANGWA